MPTKITSVRRCLLCNKPLRQRSDEYPRQFAKRKTCGLKCSRALSKPKLPDVPIDELDERIHAAYRLRLYANGGNLDDYQAAVDVLGEDEVEFLLASFRLYREPNVIRFPRKRTEIEPDGRTCPQCSRELVPHKNESMVGFKRRKFCDVACSNAYQRNNPTPAQLAARDLMNRTQWAGCPGSRDD